MPAGSPVRAPLRPPARTAYPHPGIHPPTPLPAAPAAPAGRPAVASPAVRGSLLSRLRQLAGLLVLEPLAAAEPGPFVHTAALHTTADLAASLAGITQLSREQGFSRDPETHYGDGGRSAMYHVDHRDLPVSLSVNCHPLRQTVAIAVSGLDCDDTYRSFRALEAALFGSC